MFVSLFFPRPEALRPLRASILRMGTLLAVSILAIGSLLSAQTREQGVEAKTVPSIETKVQGLTAYRGFLPFYYDEREALLYLEVPEPGSELLYLTSLSSGLGSNDVGLDRGQLGRAKLVRFERVGKRIYLVERNLRYRADSGSKEEQGAVEESFAQSVLWAGDILAESSGRVLFDAKSLLLQDVHDVQRKLAASGQGSYSLDKGRSSYFLRRTKAFPRNSEFDVRLTFVGKSPGRFVSSVTPTPSLVTLHEHHSFFALPEPGYHPRAYDPRAGFFQRSHKDYGRKLDEGLDVRYVTRHRLEKKDGKAALSPPKKPIVYYVDRAIPEPLRSAVIEGASWWKDAFTAAGFEDAFRVELLPEGVDPMDVRYNLIQWVHRSTRGWSYGASVVDPRTGEILKGHVSLGSLRVRQDRVLFEGLVPSHSCAADAGPCETATLASLDPQTTPVSLALARIRQLAAHEVGHTLGLAHNFAASTRGRASVMDYPAPLVKVGGNGKLDLRDAYARGIGAWDKIAIRYGYTQFGTAAEERKGLDAILAEAARAGLPFLSDADARASSAAHPLASLWDNGADPIQELERVMQVRRIALAAFSEKVLPKGASLGDLERIFVPVYLHHRYQVEATAKSLGGVYYQHGVRGARAQLVQSVSADRQRAALAALLRTLQPEELRVPERIRRLLMPPAPGVSGGRERFRGRTSPVFDALAAIETAADITVGAILQRERAARMKFEKTRSVTNLGFADAVQALMDATWLRKDAQGRESQEALRVVCRVVFEHLLRLAQDPRAAPPVRETCESAIQQLEKSITNWKGAVRLGERLPEWYALLQTTHSRILRFHGRAAAPERRGQEMPSPPGSPIGQDGEGKRKQR